MPLVRISLPRKLSLEVKDTISLSVHRSLIQEFNIPEDDYFHIVEELDTHQLRFPTSYLGVAHNADIVYIQIIAGAGRNLEQKRNLYQQIAQQVSASTGITKNNIIIVLLENEGMPNWSFGNGEIQTSKHVAK